MRKGILILIITASIVALSTIITVVLLKSDFSKKIINYVENKGYAFDFGTLYYKNDEETPLDNCMDANITEDCIGKGWYFDVESYIFYMNKYIQEKEVKFLFTPVYDYKTEKYNYTYRVNYKNGRLIFKGEYDPDKKDYTCDLEYSYGIEIEDYGTNICENFKGDIESFYYDAKSLITNSKMLKKIKNS